MENLNDHSKLKLALAVFTSPGAAFEEITRRKLLGTGLAIVAVTGTVAAIPPLLSIANGERAQWLQLGKSNPIAWLGLFMLYAFAMQKLLKWIGSQVDYVPLLTLMGWSQLALLVAQLAMSAMFFGQIGGGKDPLLARITVASAFLFSLWYIALMGTAVKTISGAPVARGILSYIVIELAAVIGFTWTYGNARISGFEHALPGVAGTMTAVAGADQMPWLAAAVAGLVIGVFQIGKHFEWGAQTTKIRAIAAGLVGLAAFGAYAYGMTRTNYYYRLGEAQNSYNNQRYPEAAKRLIALLPISKDNLKLMLDIADVYYLAGNDQQALAYYDKSEKLLKGETGAEKDGALARIDTGKGMVLDSEGKYPEALDQFQRAAKLSPEFREPWVRMAVTYDRMGNYDKAIESGNHAVKKLESEATVAWIALAEAFAATGDTVQAKAAITMVKSRDEKLAGRMGSKLDDWKTAVSKLTKEDLKFPLEAKLAPEPKKPTKAKPAPAKKATTKEKK